jgi:hypothetical protein
VQFRRNHNLALVKQIHLALWALQLQGQHINLALAQT